MEFRGDPLGDLHLREAALVPALQHRGTGRGGWGLASGEADEGWWCLGPGFRHSVWSRRAGLVGAGESFLAGKQL